MIFGWIFCSRWATFLHILRGNAAIEDVQRPEETGDATVAQRSWFCRGAHTPDWLGYRKPPAGYGPGLRNTWALTRPARPVEAGYCRLYQGLVSRPGAGRSVPPSGARLSPR